MNLTNGQLVSHYRIIERLGAGGMGVVYKAQDTRLNRPVALKFLPHDDLLTPHAKERFIHEARAASALDHPNICTIHEIDETEDGQLFLVMSCYEGETLRSRIHRGALATKDAVSIALQLCEAIGAAHQKQIVHRDLKPDNIMVLPDGLVKVLDFGLAKLLGQTRLTTEGTTLGTVAYMSPEQVQSSDVDHRTDIYSLSVILYEMLTGEVPFRGEHHLATFYLIVNEPPPFPRSLNPSLPERLQAVVLKGMEKKKENRYQSCEPMREELLPFAPEASAHPVRASVGARAGNFLRTRVQKRTLYAAIGVVLLALAAIIIPSRPHPNAENRAAARTLREKAVNLMDAGKLTEAQHELDSALEADPTYALAWSTMAAVSTRLGNLDVAIAQGTRAVALDSNNANAQYNLGYALEAKGQLIDALASYANAVRIDSLYMPAQSALACLYLRLDDPAKASAILDHAIRIDRGSRYLFLLYRSLGKAHLKAGRFAASIEALKRSLELQPDQGGEAHRTLASAYRATSMIKEARAELRASVAAETDRTKKEEAQRELDSLALH